MGENAYHIIKVLNNNVVLTKKVKDKQEMILIGKGIGFGNKANRIAVIDENRIQKRYRSQEGLKEEYVQLFNAIDSKVIGVVEEIILLAEKKLGHLDEHIHIALVDHVGFALERLKRDMVFVNPFLDEIRVKYKDEYNLALKGRTLLYKRLGVMIPEDEVGYIALHLYSAKMHKNIKHTIRDINHG